MNNCTHISELLPWYVAGSLEDADRRAVDDHLSTCESCRQALEESRFTAAVHGYHPTPAELVELVFGDAPPPDATIARHVAACDLCTEEIEALSASQSELRNEDPRHVADPADQSAAPSAAPATPATVVSFPPPAPTRPWHWLAAAAAVIAMVASAGWFQSAQRTSDLAQRAATLEQRIAGLDAYRQSAGEDDLRRQEELLRRLRSAEERVADDSAERQRLLDELNAWRSPEVNTAVVDLYARDLVLRGDGRADLPTIELAADARFLTLLFLPPGPGPYELRLQGPNGRELATASGLMRSPAGDATVTLSTDAFESALAAGNGDDGGLVGPLTVRLLDANSGSRTEAAAEYPFQLRRGGS